MLTTMAFDALYIHGAERRGTAAWPALDHEQGSFLSFEPGSTIAEQADLLMKTRAERRNLFFAHSIGAVPAVLAAASGRLDIAGLVLVEPALYDIARGEAVIERHIAAVSEARCQAADGNLRGFWAILRPLMFGGGFDAARWDDERRVAEHWSTTNIPWGHGVRAEMLDGIPTLIVTGGWNEEYDLIAELLGARGAEHVVLTGAEHRAQDLPAFGDVVREFGTRLR